MVGYKENEGVVATPVYFGRDASYDAYIIRQTKDEKIAIGEHYSRVATFSSWITIYDDDGKTFHEYGDEINIYRAGEMGCIIQIISEGGLK